MVKKSFYTVPPYEVETTIKQLGHNLRTARLNRNLTIDEVANKLGTGRRAIADAENGKISTGIGIYAGILWAIGLLSQLNEVADPGRDTEGQILSALKERARKKKNRDYDDDF